MAFIQVDDEHSHDLELNTLFCTDMLFDYGYRVFSCRINTFIILLTNLTCIIAWIEGMPQNHLDGSLNCRLLFKHSNNIVEGRKCFV